MSALHHALRLADAGIPVFACNADKRPVTARGFHDASADTAEVREMFGKPGAVLVAIPTGAASGVVVLDGDQKAAADGVATLRHWTQSGRLPKTRVHTTRRGGVHLLFRHDPAHPLRCSVSKLALAVDTRGCGGYAVWWPAAGGAVLHEMPLARLPGLPGWVADEVAPDDTPRRSLAALDSLAGAEARLTAVMRKVATAMEGERNSLLYWGACRCAEMVAAGALDAGTALAELMRAAVHLGLSEREAEATIRSGLGGGSADGR
jgi:hypothetical protein